jgi:hypothetical protein
LFFPSFDHNGTVSPDDFLSSRVEFEAWGDLDAAVSTHALVASAAMCCVFGTRPLPWVHSRHAFGPPRASSAAVTTLLFWSGDDSVGRLHPSPIEAGRNGNLDSYDAYRNRKGGGYLVSTITSDHYLTQDLSTRTSDLPIDGTNQVSLGVCDV